MSNDGVDDADTDSGFLNRWSSRKRQVKQESVSVAIEEEATQEYGIGNDVGSDSIETTLPVLTDAHDAEPAAENTELTPEEPLLSDQDMPPIDTLTAQSDLSDFFNKGVSAALRRTALRHVFSLPIYNVRDGLNDYDDDYTNFEPLGDTITSDMKWHKARKEREAAEAEAASAEEAPSIENEEESAEELDEAGDDSSQPEEINNDDTDREHEQDEPLLADAQASEGNLEVKQESMQEATLSEENQSMSTDKTVKPETIV